MKLDRNVNTDGRGKYALINLRDNTVQWGGTPQEQFFVLKYKDIFASHALSAYAKSVREAALKIEDAAQRDEYLEFADQMDKEAEAAFQVGFKLPD